jgi:hypothetical protein
VTHPTVPGEAPDRGATGGRRSLVGSAPGAACALREVRIPPGALVVVERGAVAVACAGGARRAFVAGDVLCLSHPAPRALRNRGPAPAVLSAVTRRR